MNKYGSPLQFNVAVANEVVVTANNEIKVMIFIFLNITTKITGAVFWRPSERSEWVDCLVMQFFHFLYHLARLIKKRSKTSKPSLVFAVRCHHSLLLWLFS